MKRRENSEKILFYKKLNKYNKTNHFRKRLDDTNPSLWPLIINRKNKYDNSKIDSILQSTNDKKDKYINNRNSLKNKNSFTLLFSMPNKKSIIVPQIRTIDESLYVYMVIDYTTRQTDKYSVKIDRTVVQNNRNLKEKRSRVEKVTERI